MIRILLFVFILLSINGLSQDFSKVLYVDSDVKITASLVDCERKDNGTHIQYYYITIDNLTNKKLSVSFKRETWYNGRCTTCNTENREYIFNDSIEANLSKTGDCNINTEKQYRVFSKMLNFDSNSILTDFKISNVKIEKL